MISAAARRAEASRPGLTAPVPSPAYHSAVLPMMLNVERDYILLRSLNEVAQQSGSGPCSLHASGLSGRRHRAAMPFQTDTGHPVGQNRARKHTKLLFTESNVGMRDPALHRRMRCQPGGMRRVV